MSIADHLTPVLCSAQSGVVVAWYKLQAGMLQKPCTHTYSQTQMEKEQEREGEREREREREREGDSVIERKECVCARGCIPFDLCPLRMEH